MLVGMTASVLRLVAPLTLGHREEGFREDLELQPDGTFSYVCDYHVIHGGQYDEDDYVDTYTGVFRYHPLTGDAAGVLVLEVRRADRRVLGRPWTIDLGHEPPELLAFLDRGGSLAELVHAKPPLREKVALSIAAEQEFFAARAVRADYECRCKVPHEHALRRPQ